MAIPVGMRKSEGCVERRKKKEERKLWKATVGFYMSQRKMTSSDGTKVKRARHTELWSVPPRQPSDVSGALGNMCLLLYLVHSMKFASLLSYRSYHSSHCSSLGGFICAP